jgi:hypothetical protein
MHTTLLLCYDHLLHSLTGGAEHPALEVDTAIIDEAGCVLEMVRCTCCYLIVLCIL